MAEFNYQDLEKLNGDFHQQVEFFSLKNDKDEAIVRFAFDSLDELQFVAVHNVVVNGKYRKASCLRTNLKTDPVEKCPLCASGNPLQKRVFVKLIQYNLDERDENGRPTYTAKVWERSANFKNTLLSYINNYAPLSDAIFKIVRNGVAGDTKTTYDILPCMPAVYNPELYAKDFSAFDNYNVIGTIVIDEDANGLTQILNGTWQPKQRSNQETVQTVSVSGGNHWSAASTNMPQSTVTQVTPNWSYTPTQTTVAEPTKPKRTYNY